MEVKFNGQLLQDKIVWETFYKGKHNGVYIDIGANDGVKISNTKFFDDIGWKGICVEPIPDVFSKLCLNRPNAINVWGAAYDTTGKQIFRVNKGWTAELSGIEQAYDPRHIDRINNEQKIHGGTSEFVEVPTFTITSLLQEHGMCEIDYMSLDVEGSEMKVLQGIDFSKVTIRVITIEDNYGDESKYDSILLANGYKKLARVEWDLVYYLERAFAA